ncbi:hypothetical protein [Streptomyces cinnamoneus]|uniref:Uncharacterized protein n=1 Tax=Streptomyces cinnamoneus TaxID=53446 RepID=A0A918TFG4_STRCJ|nr:hypothetical protein [Streptomyces cinnamoneus]GHC45371.1 hypothetical protein GCM10010507_20770 [Streptomyces cinnamoneus]
MKHKTRMGALVGVTALSVAALATPNAEAASRTAHYQFGKCFADVYVHTNNTGPDVEAFFGIFCERGGSVIVTPWISLLKNGHAYGNPKSPGIRIVSEGNGVNYSVAKENGRGKQCYQGKLSMDFLSGTEIPHHKYIKTPCLNV